MSIVGDAFARPPDRRAAHGRPTTCVAAARSPRAARSRATTCKEALLELLPHVTIVDGYGASETGGMAFGATERGGAAAAASPGAAGAAVLSRRSHPLPRSRATTRSAGPRGAGAFRSATSATARRPRRRSRSSTGSASPSRAIARGSPPTAAIVLLGRDSLVVNSGGEKIFVEEVEDVLRRHPDVVDALVVGRPSERFGEEVVGIVQLRAGGGARPAELREFIAQSIARFKAPRAIAFASACTATPAARPTTAGHVRSPSPPSTPRQRESKRAMPRSTAATSSGRSRAAAMMRWTEPTAWARSTLCTASKSAATSPKLLGAHLLPHRGELGLPEADFVVGRVGDRRLQRPDALVGPRAIVDLSGEHDRRCRGATDHRGERPLHGEHLHVIVQRRREHDEGATVVSGHDAQHERPVEVDDRPPDLGAVLELQPAQ